MIQQELNKYQIVLIAVKIASKQLDISVPDVVYLRSNQLPSSTISAMYIRESKTIVINNDWLHDSDLVEILAICFHECRHAYQHYCVVTQTGEDISTRSRWAAELSSYYQPDTNNLQEMDTNYLHQSIERDAVEFSYKLLRQLM